MEGITIINDGGKIIKSIKGSIKNVDVSELISGIYFVQIKTNKEVINQKIIKK